MTSPALSENSSTNSTETPKDQNELLMQAGKAYVGYVEKLGRLKLWAGTLAGRNIEAHQRRQRRNIDAEDRWGLKAMTGQEPDPIEEDEMGDTILGNQTVHHHHEAPKRKGLGTVGKVLLGTAVAATGLGVPVGLGLAAMPVIAKLFDRDSAETKTETKTYDYGVDTWVEPPE